MRQLIQKADHRDNTTKEDIVRDPIVCNTIVVATDAPPPRTLINGI